MVKMLRTVSLICLLTAFAILAAPVASQAQVAVGVSIRVGPPPLPVYVQPPVPAPGYIWTPGYWAYGPEGYYWVPGTWVEPPSVGLLWTPGYWGWRHGFYVWNGGYWGPHVGFYGGINYGFGYGGVGFVGGAWRGGVFSYNRAVTNVNTTIIHNSYHTTVINNTTVINRTSFNGGTGGVHAQPTRGESLAMREHHIEPTRLQNDHFHAASTNRSLLASENHGHPSVAASSKPGVFSGEGVVSARNANRNAVNNTSFKSGSNAVHSTNNVSKNNTSFKGNGGGSGSGKTSFNGHQGSFKSTGNIHTNTAVHAQPANGGKHGSNSHNNNNSGNSHPTGGRKH
jgi:hypothetical protein